MTELRFPQDTFTRKGITAHTKDGDRKVTYRAYEHIPYVTNPVDVEYQSLDVWVPETVDGVEVDAQNAPILFVIGVGGYMSCNNYHKDMMPGMPGPEGPGGMPPMGGPGGEGPAMLPGLGGAEGPGENKALAMAYGFVIVAPGCRGRDCQATDGTYFGKAPAALVDLKAAVRYLREMGDAIPGNKDRILSTGGSAGGALSCLLGASGNSPLYDEYLRAIGAANQRDDIFASCSFSPIIDLEHADGGYEWQYGNVPCSGTATGPVKIVPGLVDQTLSAELRNSYIGYVNELALTGKDGFGPITGDNLSDYLMEAYLLPEASRYIAALSKAERADYLAKTPYITFSDGRAAFTWEAFVEAEGRMKGLPAFDDFGKEMAEPDLFGTETVKTRHFTSFSKAHDPSETDDVIGDELAHIINLMNPYYFAKNNNPGCAPHWWMRYGALDRDTSIPVFTGLATILENKGKHVNARLVWEGGHCADDDPDGVMIWMKELSK